MRRVGCLFVCECVDWLLLPYNNNNNKNHKLIAIKAENFKHNLLGANVKGKTRKSLQEMMWREAFVLVSFTSIFFLKPWPPFAVQNRSNNNNNKQKNKKQANNTTYRSVLRG